MVAPRKRTPQMFMPTQAPAAPTSAATMFTAPLQKKRGFDWASLLQGVGAGLLTGRNVGEGLGQGLILARQFADQREDNDRQQERIDRENARFDYTMQRDAKADEAAAAQLAQQNAAIDALNIPAEHKAALKAGVVSYNDIVPKAKDPSLTTFYEGDQQYQGYLGPDGKPVRVTPNSPRWQGPQAPSEPERVRLAKAAGLTPGTPEYQQFLLGKDDTPAGPFQGTGLDAQSYNIVLTGDPTKPEYAAAYAQLAMPKVQFDPVTGKSVTVQPDMSWARKPVGQAAPTPAPEGTTTQTMPGATVTSNPGAPVFNEGQGKAAGFSDRMLQANDAFDTFAAAGMDRFEDLKSGVPVFGNSLISSDRQQFDQAERNFINAQLRRESGAVISPEEFKEARKQYIPQPGDSADVLAQKKESRRIAIEAMKREGGPFYKPDAAPTGGSDYKSKYGLE